MLRDSGGPEGFQHHPQGDGAFQWIQHDADQPNKNPPCPAWSGSNASALMTPC